MYLPDSRGVAAVFASATARICLTRVVGSIEEELAFDLNENWLYKNFPLLSGVRCRLPDRELVGTNMSEIHFNEITRAKEVPEGGF